MVNEVQRSMPLCAGKGAGSATFERNESGQFDSEFAHLAKAIFASRSDTDEVVPTE
jgi:hypothetical protein